MQEGVIVNLLQSERISKHLVNHEYGGVVRHVTLRFFFEFGEYGILTFGFNLN